MNIFQRYIHRYGKLAQIEILIEEMAELIHVLQKYKRKKFDPNTHVTWEEIIGEAVDVTLVLAQLKFIFPDPLLWKATAKQKISRMFQRMDAET